ncbi:hypothetical protein DPMN_026267 [Dreissena polymorpha]|uniref:Uncharacterized protein n=1 Tax=Dreissena polymorpha TaxID=45954 RepID=A0A9D4LSL8_DREPO|nr:hypothetical protein DPMN_026267 [Dreissena polymorpha]
MYLPTPITMPGARQMEVGNHSFLTSTRLTSRPYRNKCHDKHPSFDKRHPWGSNLRPTDPEADALSTRPRRPSPTLDPGDPVSYRGIALASAIYKVYRAALLRFALRQEDQPAHPGSLVGIYDACL